MSKGVRHKGERRVESGVVRLDKLNPNWGMREFKPSSLSREKHLPTMEPNAQLQPQSLIFPQLVLFLDLSKNLSLSYAFIMSSFLFFTYNVLSHFSVVGYKYPNYTNSLSRSFFSYY